MPARTQMPQLSLYEGAAKSSYIGSEVPLKDFGPKGDKKGQNTTDMIKKKKSQYIKILESSKQRTASLVSVEWP